eukprot:5328090-Amphidinium_carterae.5
MGWLQDLRLKGFLVPKADDPPQQSVMTGGLTPVRPTHESSVERRYCHSEHCHRQHEQDYDASKISRPALEEPRALRCPTKQHQYFTGKSWSESGRKRFCPTASSLNYGATDIQVQSST